MRARGSFDAFAKSGAQSGACIPPCCNASEHTSILHRERINELAQAMHLDDLMAGDRAGADGVPDGKKYAMGSETERQLGYLRLG
jgi:hypothetical protein